MICTINMWLFISFLLFIYSNVRKLSEVTGGFHLLLNISVQEVCYIYFNCWYLTLFLLYSSASDHHWYLDIFKLSSVISMNALKLHKLTSQVYISVTVWRPKKINTVYFQGSSCQKVSQIDLSKAELHASYLGWGLLIPLSSAWCTHPQAVENRITAKLDWTNQSTAQRLFLFSFELF